MFLISNCILAVFLSVFQFIRATDVKRCRVCQTALF